MAIKLKIKYVELCPGCNAGLFAPVTCSQHIFEKYFSDDYQYINRMPHIYNVSFLALEPHWIIIFISDLILPFVYNGLSE